nr:hypothetical protein Iba_chr08bCG14030 [Ipomoea batatas]
MKPMEERDFPIPKEENLMGKINEMNEQNVQKEKTEKKHQEEQKSKSTAGVWGNATKKTAAAMGGNLNKNQNQGVGGGAPLPGRKESTNVNVKQGMGGQMNGRENVNSKAWTGRPPDETVRSYFRKGEQVPKPQGMRWVLLPLLVAAIGLAGHNAELCTARLAMQLRGEGIGGFWVDMFVEL